MDPAPQAPSPPQFRRPTRRPVHRMVLVTSTLVFALVVLWALSLVKPYRVSSGSMAPTAISGQRIIADHLGDDGWNPKPDEIIVFKAPAGARVDADRECGSLREPGTACLVPLRGETPISFVKRVVGVPGDRIEVKGGHVVRNGRLLSEPFAEDCDGEICNLAEFTVPPDAYFVMGDNRDDSSDSRYWGPVPREQIIGRVFGSYWPPSRFGAL
ncbi:MAG: signal peptidase I [Solirubrobacteraceae bacterium]|nr:signal peptidase I [Solirubrobacteraceae bacterium]